MNYPKLIHKNRKSGLSMVVIFFKKKTGWFPKMKFDHGIKTIINESLKDN